ncbi:UDP-N-acetylmuramoyl-tripeptide--D-alanyl-D-alanine ligase [Tunicatimonas pelagia]|uniref:UDP-N-acetylmuramoyl-tripeptide--D-alanyl-D- alanine ligase n=1 Tax=Tunicatimonas pelagia TaxID=931531 RepID=UPI0026662D64|nr:UDP-N-acetylmuramoyl-tripeptide--D-alanyl-D-alanine ligase [Tunicatimonas pelagia]WKN42227.1 UDP-N-acetylmuramoyl-tripeptide--D-alanyl-D-alanine ligase [Tunicatimonas pelagia]
MKTTEELYKVFLRCGKVSTDTRKIESDSMFFALKGANFNGNQFADEALEKGASYAVIDETEFQQDERFLLVEDVLTALQELAHHHRMQLDIPVIGINGTNGKTTTKELLHAVLSQKYQTLATKGNLNNHIGVPLTLLEITKDIEIAIIELGANAVGEIATLCQIAHPTYGLTTNIGKAHMEGFGGLEGAIRGESEQYDYMRKTKGTVFINSQNPILSNMAKRFGKPYFYPAEGDYFHCEFISADPFVCYRHESGQEVETQLLGGYNFENISAALCIGKFFGVPTEQANKAVAYYQPSNKRSQIVKKDSNTIILDAYNANPDSMQAAIENLKAMQAPQKVAILGDMYELGEDSPQEHRAIGEQLASARFTQVFLCGELMKDTADAYPQAHYFPQKEDLEAFLKENPIQESIVLLKASRGIALETLVDLF